MRKTPFYRVWTTGAGVAALILIYMLLFQGCAPEHISKDFGRSYEAVLSAQTVNPDAPADRTPPDLPGEAAEGIYNDYLNDIGTLPGNEQSEQKGGENSEKKSDE